jgi:hypothetical protein
MKACRPRRSFHTFFSNAAACTAGCLISSQEGPGAALLHTKATAADQHVQAILVSLMTPYLHMLLRLQLIQGMLAHCRKSMFDQICCCTG